MSAKNQPHLSDRQKATLAYLEAQGVKLDPKDVQAPDIDSLSVGVSRPFDFVGRDGSPTPPELEFYRVEHLGDDPKSHSHLQNTIRAMEAEGYRVLKGEHGIHQRGQHTPGAETIMVRTAEQAEAYRRAQVLHQRRMLTGRENVPTQAGAITYDRTITDERTVTGRLDHQP